MPEYLKQPSNPITEAVSEEITRTVTEVIRAVRDDGVAALRRYSERYDRWNPPSFRVSEAEIRQAERDTGDELKQHIAFVQAQVRHFAELQRAGLSDFEETTLPGVQLGQKHIPVNAVGSYSPGGKYPLIASSIMTVVVPKVAGVKRVVAFAPPRDANRVRCESALRSEGDGR